MKGRPNKVAGMDVPDEMIKRMEGRAKDAAVVFGGTRGLLCAGGALTIQIPR